MPLNSTPAAILNSFVTLMIHRHQQQQQHRYTFNHQSPRRVLKLFHYCCSSDGWAAVIIRRATVSRSLMTAFGKINYTQVTGKLWAVKKSNVACHHNSTVGTCRAFVVLLITRLILIRAHSSLGLFISHFPEKSPPFIYPPPWNRFRHHSFMPSGAGERNTIFITCDVVLMN